MTEHHVDPGMAGIIHPARHAAMGRPDLPADTRPGAFLADIAKGLVNAGGFDYRGATTEELERGSMPLAQPPAVGREQARWLEADDEPTHEARR